MLAVHLNPLIQWPSTTIGPTSPPYDVLPNSIGIIDGTEVFIQRPSNLETQKPSYSDYKSHTTVKCLVAINIPSPVHLLLFPQVFLVTAVIDLPLKIVDCCNPVKYWLIKDTQQEICL